MAVEICLEEPVESRHHVEGRREDPRTRAQTLAGFAGRQLGFVLILLAVLLVIIAAMLFAMQTDLIFPGSKRQGLPETEVHPRTDEELVKFSAAHGETITALFAPAQTSGGKPLPDTSKLPTLLFFYGNGMSISDSMDQIEHFRRLGANVLTPDYVGYGMSTGKPSETGCQDTADAALAYLRQRKDVDRNRIIVVGWSLGGAVAIDLASREKVAGLIALSSFTSMNEMARRNFPWMPTGLLLRHRFDSQSKIARVSCPILIGHGRQDALIPHEMADRLSSAARVPVMKFKVDDAGHNDFFSVGGGQVLQAMKAFLEQFVKE